MSLNKQLSAGLAISLAILLGLQWAAMRAVFSHLLQQQLVNSLSQDAESLLAGIEFDQNNVFTLDPKRANPVYQRPFSGHYYAIITDQQFAYSRSLWDADLGDLKALHLKAGATNTINLLGPQKQKLLIKVQSYRKHNQVISIAVAEDLASLHQALQQFQWIYGAISLAILIILLLIQRQIVINSLKPLTLIRQQLAQLEAGKIDQIASLGPNEIAPVIAEFNRLLKVISNQSRRSRDALGNLAHALKTQLAILNQTAEQSRHIKLTETIDAATTTMRHIIERELKRARLMGNALPGKRVDVRETSAWLVKTLQLIYAEKSPNITTHIDEHVQYTGDEEDLTELLGNVLDNACKWCNKNVYLTIKTEQKTILIKVEDDGAGCAINTLDDLTKRGFRLDESIAGSGLGLAIVYDIVLHHGGTIGFGRSALYGGLSVNIHLPNSNAMH